MIKNIIGFIVLFIIISYIYYKIKYPFWSIQPVFHFHNLRYWLFPPGIIQHNNPKINKFFDSAVEFNDFSALETEKKALFASLIKAHFMPNKYENYKPTTENITDYFNSHNKPCFISLYYKPSLSDGKMTNTLVSSMTTRPLKCVVDDHNLNLYYVDFLCVHKRYRKKGVAPKTIYSHYYNHRHKYDNTVFLFKREGETTAIVPLCAYKNYGFDLQYLSKEINLKGPILKSVLLSDTSMQHYYELDKFIQKNVDCYISPNYSHLKHLVDKNLLHIGLVIEDRDAKAVYVFRNSHTYYDSKPAIECIASFNNGLSEGKFIDGFLDCLVKCIERFKYQILFVENISHNNSIAKYMIKNHKLLFECSASYYFYNFAHRPIPSENVFLLN